MPALSGKPFGIATVVQTAAVTGTPAVVTDRGVARLADLLGPDTPTSVRGLLPQWDHWCDRIATVLGDVGRHGVAVGWMPESEVVFDAPLPDPSNLYMAGANFYDHITEMKAPPPDKSVEDPFHFMVPSGSLTGTGHDVLRPVGIEKLDWEVELAVVMGRRAVGVPEDEALDYVAGYAVANDVSVRDEAMFHPIFGIRFLFAKGQATLNPMGPVIVPARFVPDPGSLALSLHVNGEVRQNSSTAQMIWSVPEQIAYLSAQAPMNVGDILLTGTPAGTAAAHGRYLADGDVMTAAIEGLGVLTNRVVGKVA